MSAISEGMEDVRSTQIRAGVVGRSAEQGGAHTDSLAKQVVSGC